MSNPFDNIDMIYFINLDSRGDRKNHIINELQKMGISKSTRVSGVIDKFGALGCAKSHIICLEDAKKNNYKNCLILEDDFTFKQDKDKTYEILNKFWDSNIEWDVLMFASFVRNYRETYFPFLVKILNAQTTSGYLVNSNFFNELINNFKESVELLSKNGNIGEYCIDEYWKKLQPKNKWYILNPKIGYQYPNYSDIEKKTVTYYLDIQEIQLKRNFNHILAVKACQSRVNSAEIQKEKYFNNIDNYPLIYFKYIGDPNLKTEYSFDEMKNLLKIKCQDDYLSLPTKIYLMLKYVNEKFNIKGVFCTDDDIIINLDKLYKRIVENSSKNYWGKIVIFNSGGDLYSNWLKTKRDICEKFPVFNKYSVYIQQGPYCPGGGFYLNKNVIPLILKENQLFTQCPLDNKILETYYDKNRNALVGLHIFDDKEIGDALYRNNILPEKIDLQDCVTWN